MTASRRKWLAVALLLVGGVVLATVWWRQHRAGIQRELLQRALESQSVTREAPGDAARAAPDEGAPPEFWESYYADP